MGGLGSTRWRRYQRATRVDQCLRLSMFNSTRSLPKQGLGELFTDLCGREIRAWEGTAFAATLTLEPIPDLGFLLRVQHGGGNARLDYQISIVTTVPHFGGTRYWWLCPGCGRRVGILYRPTLADMFACRRCHGLVYTSQQRHDRRLDPFRHMDHDELLQALNRLPLCPDLAPGWEPRGWRDAAKVFLATSRMQRFHERVLSLCDG